VLAGPVDVCVAVPRLAVDRPFTYILTEDQGAGTGSLVSVPFHRRIVKGWVLGSPVQVPEGRLLPVRKVHSHVRFFDERMLRLYRWMGERYIAPLATIIERSHPPRVVGEEIGRDWAAVDAATPARSPSARSRGAPGGYAPRPTTIVLGPADIEGLLVDWMNELILLTEEGKACLAGLQVEVVGEDGLQARVDLVHCDPSPEGTELKAATYHQLAVRQVDDGWVAVVYFDV
jgi:primosomal protein N'